MAQFSFVFFHFFGFNIRETFLLLRQNRNVLQRYAEKFSNS